MPAGKYVWSLGRILVRRLQPQQDMRSLWLSMSFLVLAACNSSTGDTVAPDATPGVDYALTCESGATTFPLLDKRCAAPADCAIVRHMVSCCGTMVAIGLAKSDVTTFSAAETDCEAGYPGCGCASQPTEAEDGRSEVDGTIQVDCVDQRCTTYVPFGGN